MSSNIKQARTRRHSFTSFEEIVKKAGKDVTLDNQDSSVVTQIRRKRKNPADDAETNASAKRPATFSLLGDIQGKGQQQITGDFMCCLPGGM